MSRAENARITEAEYLALDRESIEKHEYWFGKLAVMPPASARHVLIVGNIAGALSDRLRRRPDHAFGSALRLCVKRECCYLYPDVMVCGRPELLDDRQDTLVNPELIAEVMSPASRDYDRGDKFQQYRGISSFREYLLVDQEKVHVERYRKQGDGTWSLWETECQK